MQQVGRLDKVGLSCCMVLLLPEGYAGGGAWQPFCCRRGVFSAPEHAFLSALSFMIRMHSSSATVYRSVNRHTSRQVITNRILEASEAAIVG